MGVAVQVRELTKSFGGHRVWSDVSLTLPHGEVSAILGPSGTGKSVLLKSLIGLLQPDRGQVLVDGTDLCSCSEDELYEVRKRFGVLFQDGALFGSMDLYDNVAFPLREHTRKSESEIRRIAREKMELVGLTGAEHKLPGELSGGMRRRLDLAACLVGNPEVIFLDEPTTGLDPSSRMAMWEIVERLVAEGTTVLLTTQYLDEADRLADTITVLSAGSVVASGTAAELKAQVGQRTVTVVPEPGSDPEAGCAALRRSGFDPSVGRDGTAIITPIDASRDTATVIRALDEAGIEPAELAFGEPTLDDVYLALARRARTA